MFHTFQSSISLRSPTDGEGPGGVGGAGPGGGGGGAGGGAGGAGKPGSSGRPAGSRRISTSNACVECRRRKIRCDGAQPCGQCQWYQHPEACGYAKPAQRVVPSRKLVDRLQAQVEALHKVLERVFPGRSPADVEALARLSREELLNLALSLPAAATQHQQQQQKQQSSVQSSTPMSEGAESLEALEQAPDQDPEWDEERRHKDKIQGISDDVNGLSMSVDRQSSYVGISSIQAALKVIVRVAPVARRYIVQSAAYDTALPSRSNSPRPRPRTRPRPHPHSHPQDDDVTALPPPAVEGQRLVDTYFDRVHPFFPMIDERAFRTSYLRGDRRRDRPWLTLANMVLALGSLAGSTSADAGHIVFFKRARRLVSLETFGSGNLEVLQALGVMAGYYMHYLNRPNEAHCIMGAVLRMATALGLHREYLESPAGGGGGGGGTNGADTMAVALNSHSHAVSSEMRRRTWWSLFCLDTWASTTTGRPSLGRMGEAITARPPGKMPERPSSPQGIEALKILPLIHFTSFCKIATRIQDRLAATPLLKFDELVALDAELVRWYDELPGLLRGGGGGGDDDDDANDDGKNNDDRDGDEAIPSFLRTPRAVMKWRYQNLRIVLHRPFVLATALRRTPLAQLAAEDRAAVAKCRALAGRAIAAIAAECAPELVAGWNGVWFAFQACMVPLLALFSDAQPAGGGSAAEEERARWSAQVETAVGFFERMADWSVAARKSRDAVAHLLEAS
ncbi:fungal-specific transcription factor domain-containing protein, partial [Lineolata rhizophorae]